MTRNTPISTRFAALTVVLALAAAGCSEPEPAPPEERAQARWERVVERDFAAAWDFNTPGYREANEREAFAEDMRGRPLRWHEAQVTGVSCEEDDICTVEVRVTYQPVGGPSEHSQMRMTRNIKERWIRLDGRWWYTRN